jgi:hypothetical protein
MLRLRTIRTDLVKADRSDHMVELVVSSGTYRVSHGRLWRLHENRLGPEREA